MILPVSWLQIYCRSIPVEIRESCLFCWKQQKFLWFAEPFAACESSPCENGATCLDVAVDTFLCLCRGGYFGLTCSESECFSCFVSRKSWWGKKFSLALVFQHWISKKIMAKLCSPTLMNTNILGMGSKMSGIFHSGIWRHFTCIFRLFWCNILCISEHLQLWRCASCHLW